MTEQYFEEEEFETAFDGRTLVQLLRLQLRHKRWVAVYLASTLAISVQEAYLTFLTKRIVDEGLVAGDWPHVVGLIVHYGAVFAGFSIPVVGFIVGAGYLGELIRYDLCRDMFARLQQLSLSYFDRTPVGWLMARLTSDAKRIGEMFSWGVMDLFWGLSSIFVSLGFMVAISWKLGLIMAAVIPILFFVALRFQTRIIRAYRHVRSTNSRLTGEYNEMLTGVRVVKSLARERLNSDRFNEINLEMFGSSFRAAFLSALFLPAVQLVAALAVGTIIGYGGWQFQLGDITIGGIQAFIAYIAFMLMPIEEMSRVFAEMQQAMACGERVFSLLGAKPEIVDAPDAANATSMRGDIEFSHVDFAYDSDVSVFTDLCLTIGNGETVALVGPTGAGKSTLVNLICRFYEPQRGRIAIGGRDVATLSQRSVQSRVGMVLQVPHLFSGTIQENIRYGRLDASDEEVLAASRLAGSHTFISTLPDAYRSVVGEEGVKLSVGQRQLVSIARAILAQPDIFIMDEATSSVDTLTESLIQQGMNEVLRDRTSLVIAHRLSTVRQADRILVVRGGGIEEMGTHSELLAAGGYYHHLYTSQFREEKGRALDPFHNRRSATVPA